MRAQTALILRDLKKNEWRTHFVLGWFGFFDSFESVKMVRCSLRLKFKINFYVVSYQYRLVADLSNCCCPGPIRKLALTYGDPIIKQMTSVGIYPSGMSAHFQ